ncbi:MAG TPA: hypothetical protein VHG28_22740 [Longimicrobiaceae bacterium]|nr:hypothetical protein [Longimicrobiaceae bacterium]
MSSRAAVLTLTLQWLIVVVTLGQAVAALRVARCRGGLSRVHRMAWILVTVAFFGRAGLGIVMNVGAVWAFTAGQESEVFAMFERVRAIGNLTNALIAVSMGWGLVALPFLRGQPIPRVWQGCILAVLILLGIGVGVGWDEKGISPRDLTSLAVLSAAELIGFLVAMLVGLYLHTLDRYLWTGLCVYAAHVALNVVWYSGMTGFFVPNAWYPSPRVMLSYALVTYTVVIGLTLRRLALAQQGIRSGGLLEARGERRHPALR